jgi:hypothetical protein
MASQTCTSLRCTGQCPVHRLVQQRTHCSRELGRAPWLKITGLSSGAPNYPVSQQLPSQQSVARSADNTWPGLTITWSHRTVWCAPDSVWCAKWTKGSTVDFARKGKRSGTIHVRCVNRQKARITYQMEIQRLLAALGLLKGPLGVWSSTPSLH